MKIKINSRKIKDYLIGGVLGLVAAILYAEAFYDLDKVAVWLVILVVPGGILFERKSEIKRKEQLLMEFRDGLSYVKNALDAGDSAENAFGAAVLPLKKLYGEEAATTKGFAEICRKIQNGMPLEAAFSDFAQKTALTDILDFADIFPVLKRTGGDLNVFISREVQNITDKQSLNREINVVTAEKRNEFHVMCLIPLAMVMYLKIFSGKIMAGVYHQPKGILFMSLMLLLYAACILGGQWILKKNLG